MSDIKLTKSHVEQWKTFWRSFHVDIEGDETLVMKKTLHFSAKYLLLWFDLLFILMYQIQSTTAKIGDFEHLLSDIEFTIAVNCRKPSTSFLRSESDGSRSRRFA